MSDMETTTAGTTEEQAVPVSPAVKEMMDAGVFFGRTKAKTHPRIKQFVIANRNGVDIINLEKTEEQLQSAMAFVREKAAKNTSMILVGTQPPAHEMLFKIGAEFALPIVTLRWLGGTLTNYRIVSQRVEYFKKLKADLASGAFAGYTKKEQLDLQKQAEKMKEIFSGLEAMKSRPDLLIVIDPVFHKTAVAEAERLGIPVVAFANSDTDPDKVEYPVLGNTRARSSIVWFLEHLAEAIRTGRKEGEAARAAALAAKEEPAEKKSSEGSEVQEK